MQVCFAVGLVLCMCAICMFLDSKHFPLSKTPLALAIEHNNVGTVRLLRRFGADMHRSILYLWSPVEYAQKFKANDIAEFLNR